MTSESDPTRATGRRFTEPLREIVALALLLGNAVFLFLGFTGLVFVLDGWASGFGPRSAITFPVFVGPLSLGLPMVAVLLATHVAPMVGRYRQVLLAACAEYAVSAVFGFATFLGAFADDLPGARATLEGLLHRAVWLGFLLLGGLVLARVYVGLIPGPRPTVRPGSATGYGGEPAQTTTYRAGSAAPPYDGPTVDTGWPVVPPPPQPEPLVAPSDATVRVPRPATASPASVPAPAGPPAQQTPSPPPPDRAPAPDPAPADRGGGATQVVPPPHPAQPEIEDPIEPPTRQFER